MLRHLLLLIFFTSLYSCTTTGSSEEEINYPKGPLFSASYDSHSINTDLLSDKLKEKIYSVEESCYSQIFELFQQIVIETYIQEMATGSNISYKEAQSRLQSSMGFSFLGLSQKEQTDLLYNKISSEKNVHFTYKRDSLPLVNIETSEFPKIYSTNSKDNSKLIKVVVFLSLTSLESKTAYSWLSTLKDDSYLKDRVEVVYKFCPLSDLDFFISFEKGSFCASKQNLFNEYASYVFEHHDTLTDFPQNRFVSSIGLNEADFNKCMSEKFDLLNQSLDEQKRYSINSTPTFFIDGRKYFNIASLSDLKTLVEQVSKNK